MTSTFPAFAFRTVALVTLAVAPLLTGAAVADDKATSHFEAAPCPEMPGPIPELKSARCGRLTVPESRAHPNGRTITLSVAIIPAASPNPKPDPIVWLAGG